MVSSFGRKPSCILLTEEVLKSSEIEGEKLDRDQVRSSIARRLGIDIGGLTPADRNVEGVVEMMLDATQRYDQPLTARRLFDWHAALFPTGRSGMSKINVGAWRDDKGPMQVVSGPIGKERVHYEAPAADRVRDEMKKFLDWFEKDNSTDLVLKAGVAHLWFVTIHPFDDGNGRIARAIADMVLARSERSPQRFYSMSAQIRQERKAYYDILEATQKGDLDITRWLEWFLECLGRAFDRAETILAAVLNKARFWERFAGGGIQRAAARDRQPAAERLRRQADFLEMGQAREMFAGHGAARHRGPDPKESPDQGCCRRAQHVIFIGQTEMMLAGTRQWFKPLFLGPWEFVRNGPPESARPS